MQSFTDAALNKALTKTVKGTMKQMSIQHETKPVVSSTKSQGVSFSDTDVVFWVRYLCTLSCFG